MNYYSMIITLLLFSLHFPFIKPQALSHSKKKTKDWNFMVYMVNNNNLYRFGLKNFREMQSVGSNDNVNVLLQMDELGARRTKRYYIEKDNPIEIDKPDDDITNISGTAINLYNFLEWGIRTYPAKHQCIILWNHGSGIKDPSIWGRVIMKYRDEFFYKDPQSGLLSIDRSAMDDSMLKVIKKHRGVGFNDTAEEYLTNQDLKSVLEKVSSVLLHGNKIDIICMDACHMGMVEVASQIKSSTDFLVASQEVEPGSGYDYYEVLNPFTKQTFSPEELAQHVVKSYETFYEPTTGDYTQSAIRLAMLEQVENNIKLLSNKMVDILRSVNRQNFLQELRFIRSNRRLTTAFFDIDYIDLLHFYQSLQEKLINNTIFKHLIPYLEEGKSLLSRAILLNSSGVNLPNAQGLSIYFPHRRIHKSYYSTEFINKTNWHQFLEEYQKMV